MKTIVVKFTDHQGDVKISNVQLMEGMKFSLDLQIKEEGKKRYGKTITVLGKYTYPVLNWMMDLHDVFVKVADPSQEKGFRWEKTTEKRTKFQSYLLRKGLPESTQLKDIVFECKGNSEIFDDCPFKVVIYKNRPATLSMVHVAPKGRKETLDPKTGELTFSYYNKETIIFRGRTIPKPLDPEMFRRLIIEEHEEVEVFQEV